MISKFIKILRLVILGTLSFTVGLTISFAVVSPEIRNVFSRPITKESLPRVYIVESGSMEPTIRVGSIVVSVPGEVYSQNDVVSFKQGKNIVTHRIMAKMYPDGIDKPPVYKTAGDANKTFDVNDLENGNVVGKVVLTLPYLGYAANFAKQPYGFILLVIVPATIVIYEELKGMLKEIKKLLTSLFEKLRKRNKKDETKETEKVRRAGGFSPAIFSKVAVVIPIFGALLVFAGLASAFFNDIEKSNNNSFQAAAWGTPTPTLAPTGAVSPTPTPLPIATTLVINEVLPHTACFSGNTEGQFVELWNGSAGTVNLKDYKLSDINNNVIAISNANANLATHSFAILVKSNGVINTCLNGNVNNAMTLNLGGTIDINSGQLQLLDSGNNVVDTVKWGTSPNPIPAIENSIERNPTGMDSALGINFTPSDFVIRTTPQPGL